MDTKDLINSAMFLQCNSDKLNVVCVYSGCPQLLRDCTDINLQRLDS